MKTAADIVGKPVRSDVESLGVKVIGHTKGQGVVYGFRFEPQSIEEHRKYHEAGAFAYELYVMCSEDNTVVDVNHRVNQTPCSCHSHAPSNAPAWLFPETALFDIIWEDIPGFCRTRMMKLLKAMVAASKTSASRKAATPKAHV